MEMLTVPLTLKQEALGMPAPPRKLRSEEGVCGFIRTTGRLLYVTPK